MTLAASLNHTGVRRDGIGELENDGMGGVADGMAMVRTGASVSFNKTGVGLGTLPGHVEERAKLGGGRRAFRRGDA